MNPLITILAHAGVEDIIERHMPLWKAHGWKMQMFVPVDGVIPLTELAERHGVGITGIGHRGQGGSASVAERIRNQFVMLSAEIGVSHHIILEYDSFFLETPKLRNGVSGILFDNHEAPKFTAPVYPNPPWIIDTYSAFLIAEWMDQYPDASELGYMDRLIATAASGCGIPLLPFDPPGFSRGTIDLDKNFEQLAFAIDRGATAFHGVKEAHVLNFITGLYEKKQHGLSVTPSAIASRL